MPTIEDGWKDYFERVIQPITKSIPARVALPGLELLHKTFFCGAAWLFAVMLEPETEAGIDSNITALTNELRLFLFNNPPNTPPN